MRNTSFPSGRARTCEVECGTKVAAKVGDLRSDRSPRFGRPKPSSENVQLADFAKVMAVDGQGNGQWEQLRTAKSCPEEKLPVLAPFFTSDAQVKDRAEEGKSVLKVHWSLDFRGLVFSQKSPQSHVVLLW